MAAQRAAKAAQKAAKKGTAPVVSGAVGERINSVSEVVRENRKLILGVLLAVTSVFVLAAAWNVYSSITSRNAGSALAQAVAVASENMRAEQKHLVAGADKEEYESEQENASPDPERTLAKFEQTVANHPGSAAAKWARLGEARELYEAARYDEAARSYDAALKAAGDNEYLRSRALEGLGFCLEIEKKYDQARDRFEQMGALASGTFKPLADYHVARMHLAQGDEKRAGAILSELVSSLQSGSPDGLLHRYVRFEASARLRELGISPQRSKGAAPAPAMRGGKASVRKKAPGTEERAEQSGKPDGITGENEER